jgi:phage/plasmid-associated DNA primase
VAAEDISLLQRFCGAVLLGPNRAQRFLVVHGSAAAGKSTFVSIVEKIIGVENVAHLRTEHLGGRFETHAYLGKTLIAAKDVAGDFLSSKGAKMIKALVGDDQLEAEQKFGGKHRFRGDLQLIITSNCRLKLAFEDDEEAWRRRLLIVEFDRQVPANRVPNFADVLLHDEGEGILRWMIEGAVRHLAELQKCGDYELTEIQRGRINDVLLESKSPAEFVRIGLIKKAGADVTVEELKENYFRFCRDRGWQPFSERQFENALAELMLRHHGVHRRNDLMRGDKAVRGFKGVALLSKAPTTSGCLPSDECAAHAAGRALIKQDAADIDQGASLKAMPDEDAINVEDVQDEAPASGAFTTTGGGSR